MFNISYKVEFESFPGSESDFHYFVFDVEDDVFHIFGSIYHAFEQMGMLSARVLSIHESR